MASITRILTKAQQRSSAADLTAPDRTPAWRSRSWVALRIMLGLLLLITAALKLAGRHISPMPQIGWFGTPMVQLAAAEWEIALAVWLLSGRYQIGAWLAALGTFLSFATVSGYLGAIGQASCGCFGALAASPWYAFGVDVAAILLLVAFRPSLGTLRQSSWTELRRPILTCVGFGLAVVSVLVSFMIAGRLAYGSSAAAIAHLRGQHITVEPAYLDVGTGQPNQLVEARVTVHNWSDHSVRLIGARQTEVAR